MPLETQANTYKAPKDLPIQLVRSSQPLRATLLLASFGSTQAFSNHVFNLELKADPNVPLPQIEKPLRYGKLAEINHIFRADPKSGPMIISLFFVLAVLATVPVLFGAVCNHSPRLNISS
jgi:oligosaccharyltransferase complex subunit delta (ribophorin II)